MSLPFYSCESDEGMMMTLPFLLILCRHLTRPDIQSLPPFPEGVHTRLSYCPAVAYYMDKLCIRKDIVQKTDSRHARDLTIHRPLLAGRQLPATGPRALFLAKPPSPPTKARFRRLKSAKEQTPQ